MMIFEEVMKILDTDQRIRVYELVPECWTDKKILRMKSTTIYSGKVCNLSSTVKKAFSYYTVVNMRSELGVLVISIEKQ